jgi:peptidoglycan-N-acetylglucosamine deacetylase
LLTIIFACMHKYFIKTPWIARKLFPQYTWRVETEEKKVYLSFDDGPHPEITPWVLDELRRFNAKASFFCIGNNVEKYPGTYQQILDEGHAVGNHTWSHCNGWKTGTHDYVEDVKRAAVLIPSNMFRPPYGRIRGAQARLIPSAMAGAARIVMWDVLSADFDNSISSQQCLENVIVNYSRGSIIVFHDSEKALPHLQTVLPLVLENFRQEGYQCEMLPF